MRAAWTTFWLFAIVLAAALGLAHRLVPEIVPIAYAEGPQPSWVVMTAFFLRAIAMIALAVIVGGVIQRRVLGR